MTRQFDDDGEIIVMVLALPVPNAIESKRIIEDVFGIFCVQGGLDLASFCISFGLAVVLGLGSGRLWESAVDWVTHSLWVLLGECAAPQAPTKLKTPALMKRVV